MGKGPMGTINQGEEHTKQIGGRQLFQYNNIGDSGAKALACSTFSQTPVCLEGRLPL